MRHVHVTCACACATVLLALSCGGRTWRVERRPAHKQRAWRTRARRRVRTHSLGQLSRRRLRRRLTRRRRAVLLVVLVRRLRRSDAELLRERVRVDRFRVVHDVRRPVAVRDQLPVALDCPCVVATPKRALGLRK
eukprot:5484419-Prymnesium_polylepis.1